MGMDRIHGRQLLLTTLTDSWQWADPMLDRFVLFTGADATSASDTQIASYAQASVASGCAYVCCWGPDCERVHDAFDRAAADQTVFSTWHSAERLAEAMYFRGLPDASRFRRSGRRRRGGPFRCAAAVARTSACASREPR